MKFHNAFSIGLVVLALTGLLIAGNSGAPPLQDTIGTENVRIESNYDSGTLVAVIYYNDVNIYNINSGESVLAFNNTEKPLHKWFSNSTDPKNAEYSKDKDYEQLKVYFYNKSSDVARAGYIFRLWNNETIDTTFFTDTADDSKFGRAGYTDIKDHNVAISDRDKTKISVLKITGNGRVTTLPKSLCSINL